MPPQGLSIATPDPAYIIGNWNVQLAKGGTSDAGSSDTTYALPSAIYADAITVLSSAWNPANSTLAISSRNRHQRHGQRRLSHRQCSVEWQQLQRRGGKFSALSGKLERPDVHYNGSMVCMFNSQIANAPWPGTGTVYNPPTRNWAFDQNFSNPAKQPPMMPQVISVQRSKWALLTPYTTSF